MMATQSLSDLPGWLWERATAADRRLLMLDYDGTLAPFRVDREHAYLPRPLLSLLGRLSESKGTGVAVISGRPVAELTRFLGSLHVPLFGEHGWESQLPGGSLVQHELSAGTVHALQWASMVPCREPWVSRLESKRTALLLHTRGLPREEALRIESRCARLWAPILNEQDDLRLNHVSSGIELRAIGRHKGLAVREMVDSAMSGTFPVYIGDDETDEDGFREVLQIGAGLLVAAESRPTLAVGRLGSPSEVAAFLMEWHARLEGIDSAMQPPYVQRQR